MFEQIDWFDVVALLFGKQQIRKQRCIVENDAVRDQAAALAPDLLLPSICRSARISVSN